MEDYLFRAYLSDCRSVTENTRYVEIMNYSDPFYNSCEEHPLPNHEFENFVRRQGAFAPPRLKAGATLLSGMRLIVQQSAQVKDTFSPHVISLTREAYELMVRAMRLPMRAIEGTSIVGPFFWSDFDDDDEDPHLHIVYRKSDVKKKGKTRGWEMMLSYSLLTGITSGYAKGTPNAQLELAIKHLRECARQAGHPMLLPLIVLSNDLSSTNDRKQRDARDWLRQLENAVSMRDDIETEESYFQNDMLDLDAINRDLVECHSQVLWKRPQAYQAIVAEMVATLVKFKSRGLPDLGPPPEDCPRRELEVWRERIELDKLHRSMHSRLDFYRIKLVGTEHYAHTSLERLKIQREALYNVIAQRESRVNLHIAGEQKRLAHASKRDSTVMKTLSLLGALFLPGTYLASVFSMTFFDFQNGADPIISPSLWIYFALTVPITILIVGGWVYHDKRRESRNNRDAEDLEKNIEQMGHDIMATMRKRTLSKVSTWNTVSPPPR